MKKIKITNAERFDSIPDNATFIDVTYDIVEVNEAGDETILDSLRESFSLKATREDIEAHLQKKLNVYDIEKARAEEQAEIDTTLEQADATIESLRGSEVLLEKDKIKE